jgi:hypothetical protein
VTVTQKPLEYLTVPVGPLLTKAEPVGPLDGWGHLFITREALADAERLSRRGAADQPPTESGAVLVGSCCSCPETGEFYVVVTDSIELVDSVETGVSLTYTDTTWERIQRVLEARRAADPEARAQRIVGQAHGHNFLPYCGKEITCPDCPDRETCLLTSCFASTADLTWHRSVFGHIKPLACCHIFGLDARGAPVQGSFGFRGGSLAHRGFYIIPEFPIEERKEDV